VTTFKETITWRTGEPPKPGFYLVVAGIARVFWKCYWDGECFLLEPGRPNSFSDIVTHVVAWAEPKGPKL
jgi:hypothetical protein